MLTDQEAWFAAAREDNEATIIRMAEKGHPVDLTNAEGRSALHFAAESGSYSVVSRLIMLGADINRADWLGITPLMFAASKTRKEHVVMIYGPTEWLLREEPPRISLVESLLKAGADPNLKDAALHTALTYACANIQTSIVGLLLQYGADKDLTDYEGNDLQYFVHSGTVVVGGWTDDHEEDFKTFMAEQMKIDKMLELG